MLFIYFTKVLPGEWSRSTSPLDLINIACMVGAVLCGGYAFKNSKNFEKCFNKKIMPILLDGIFQFKWTENHQITPSDLEGFQTGKNYNCAIYDDNFKGIYKNVQISLSEVDLRKKQNFGDGDIYSSCFRGILIRLLFEKKFLSHIIIKKKSFKNFNRYGFYKVHFKDVQFEKEYEVYSDNPNEAEDLLTDKFIWRYKNIISKFQAKKMVADIYGNGIYLTLSINRNLFQLATWYRPIKYVQVSEMMEELSAVLEFIDELQVYFS